MVAALALALAAAAAPAEPPAPPAPKGVAVGAFVVPARPVYAGEVFALGFAWRVDWGLFRNLEGGLEWTPDALSVEDWSTPPEQGKPEPAPGGGQVATITVRTRAMALQPGRVSLAAPSQRMSIVTGGYETDGVRIDTLGPVTAHGRAATLEVRPLPPAPSGFAGAVGRFTLTSSLDAGGKPPKVGEPLRWTVTLSGTGNWPTFGGVPARPLSRDFDVIGQPEAGEDKSGTLFEQTRRETVTIVPRRPGRFSLGPVEMWAFDPDAERYVRVTAAPLTLNVAPGAAGAARYEPEPEPRPAGEPLPPPIAGSGAVWIPLMPAFWRIALAAPVALLALLWLGLATLRARAADPAREARRAHARLTTTLAALAGAPAGEERRRLVQAWRRDVVARFKMPRAAPAAPEFDEADWGMLWSQAENYLYGPARDLPGDWADRAAAALAAREPPARFAPTTIFARRHLYPAVAMLLCVGITGTAERLVAVAPAPASGWVAHYASARTAAADGRWNEAAARAAIAWIQAPRRGETRTLWRRAAREAGVGGLRAGAAPLPDGMRGGWSALATPLVWQLLSIAGVWLAAAGAAAALLSRFGHAPARASRPGGGIAAAGLLLALGGMVGVSGYGAAAWRDAAVLRVGTPLRPLPVDTPADEAPATLAAGTFGHVDRVFLGWVRVRLADGRTGWVPRGALIPAWRPLP